MKNGVFWVVTPCGSCQNRRFGGMSVLTRTTRRNIPEDTILHSHRRENLKSYSLGCYEFKKHKTWLDEGCSKLLNARKQAKLQWLQDLSKINGDNLNNIRRESRRYSELKEGVSERQK
jgi:hypothetical protein